MQAGHLSHADRFAAGLLALSVVAALLLGLLWWMPEAADATGVTHPRYASMQVGVPASGRLLWLGWGFGACALSAFALCFALGLRRPGGARPGLGWAVFAGWLVHQVAWAGLILAYAGYADAPRESLLVGALPLPTAVMLFVLWPLPVYYVVVYLWRFERNVFGPDDQRRFDALLERQRSSEGPRH